MKTFSKAEGTYPDTNPEVSREEPCSMANCLNPGDGRTALLIGQ